MNKQLIMWSLFITPWLTIFFMNKRDLKKFIPAALFTAVTSGIILQIGYQFKIWYLREINFSLVMYGLLPVAALWVIRFTYGRFWLYAIINAILDVGFAFIIIPFFGRIGIFGVGTWTSVYVYCINIVHLISIYCYQLWQERRI